MKFSAIPTILGTFWGTFFYETASFLKKLTFGSMFVRRWRLLIFLHTKSLIFTNFSKNVKFEIFFGFLTVLGQSVSKKPTC